MAILLILNDAPYDSEKAYNALRVANQLGKDHPETEVRIFLLADGVNCAIASQNTPNGYYNIERKEEEAAVIFYRMCCLDNYAVKMKHWLTGLIKNAKRHQAAFQH